MSFSELRDKEVINVCDGKRYGHPIDIEFNEQACVISIIVPSQYGWKGFFKSTRDGIVIPWSLIRRIGDDVILVELDANFIGSC